MRKIIFLLYATFILNVIYFEEGCAQNLVECVNSKNNYLYVGVDNEIKLIVSEDSKYDSLFVLISNGEIYKDSVNYNCIPRRSGRAKLSVHGIIESDTIIILSKNFMVYTIPPIKLTIGGKTVDELPRVRKEFLLQNDVFGLHISDDIINCEEWINIEKVVMGYMRQGGFYERSEFKGNKLPDELKEKIINIPSGKQLSFEVRLSFTGNVQKTLPIFSTIVY